MSLPNNDNGGPLPIPRFIPGDQGPSPLSASVMNQITDALRSLVNMRITRGATDRVYVSQGNTVLQLEKGGGSSGGGGGGGFVEEWTTSDDYAVGDIVVLSTPASPVTRSAYGAIAASGPSNGGAVSPTYLADTSKWKCLTVPPAGQLKRYVFVSMASDHIVVAPPGGGSNISVAKPHKLRFSVSSLTLSGLTVNYTGYDTSTQSRTASWTRTPFSGTELQSIVPRYVAGDHIFVSPCDDSGVSAAPYLIDINADGRAWAKKYA